MYKTGHCKEVLNEKLDVPRFDELKEYVKKFEGNEKELYKKMLKQKVLISGLPLLFGIGVMGFFITKSSNLFTKFRYDKAKNES